MPGSNLLGECAAARNSTKGATALTLTIALVGSYTITRTESGVPIWSRVVSFDGEISEEWIRQLFRNAVLDPEPDEGKFFLKQPNCCCGCQFFLRLDGDSFASVRDEFEAEVEDGIDTDPETTPADLAGRAEFSAIPTLGPGTMNCRSSTEGKATAELAIAAGSSGVGEGIPDSIWSYNGFRDWPFTVTWEQTTSAGTLSGPASGSFLTDAQVPEIDAVLTFDPCGTLEFIVTKTFAADFEVDVFSDGTLVFHLALDAELTATVSLA